ncbi:zinc finger protein 595-like [Sitodiplosis mosellana]|uniref:zinc finger protein 595-like n=1 Tax=Sitodiplosis mosellana TaxID=263140 RepID=UPI0024445BF5|nr:zinc finger protein 595-like [Sitodiplosis mosellana]
MTTTRAVHQCLFCPQTFGSAAEKDDHVLEHFTQETCADCDQNLIRIGSNLYTVHNAVTCIKGKIKSEEHIESCFVDTVISETVAEYETRIKTEPISTAFNERVSLNRLLPMEMPPLAPIREMPPLVPIGAVHYPENPHSIHLEEITIKEEPAMHHEQKDPSTHTVDAIDKQPLPSTEPRTSRKRGGRHICNICGKTCARKDSLQGHKIRKHSTNTYFCKICCHIFDTENQLIQHKTVCESKKKQRHEFRKLKDKNASYECYLCRKESPNHAALSAHTRLSHTNRHKFKCETCGMHFVTKPMLQVHQQRRHIESLKNRRFVCSICGKSLNRMHSLKKHMSRHNEENLFKCLIEGCDECFVLARDRDEHMQTHTSQYGEQANEQKQQSDWSSVFLGVRPVAIETIWENEIQIKTEPTFECPDDPEVQYDYQSKEIASASSSKTRTDDISMERIDLREVTSVQSSQHFPNESNSKREETMVKNIRTPSTSIGKQSSQSDKGKRKPVECDICGKILSVQSSLARHKILLHSDATTYFCRCCTKIFATADELAHHKPECRRRVNGGAFDCNICKKTIHSRNSFRKHMQSHNPNNKFKCELCGVHFAQEATLANHYAVHDRGAQFPCDICGKIVSRADILRLHKIRMHSGTLYCTVCCRIFSTKKEMTEHRLICESKRKMQWETRKNRDENASYECYLCHKLYLNQAALRGHLRFKHSAEAIRFKCNICRKGFFTKFVLDSHTKRHHQQLNDRKVMCTVCGKYLATNSLQSHMYIHTKQKPFKCPHQGCRKSFRSKSSISEHMRSHTGEKPFKCTVDGCDQRFSYAVDFRRHKFKIHGIFAKKIPCTICDAIFPENTLLKAHMKKHNV